MLPISGIISSIWDAEAAAGASVEKLKDV